MSVGGFGQNPENKNPENNASRRRTRHLRTVLEKCAPHPTHGFKLLQAAAARPQARLPLQRPAAQQEPPAPAAGGAGAECCRESAAA